MARRDDREYREYLREEQRSQRGCIARRMQLAFHHGLPSAIVVLACLALPHLARGQSLSATLPDDRRITRLEQWLQRVFDHDPGTVDDAASFIALWPGSDLEKLVVDANSLARMMRNPKIGRFTVRGDPPQPAVDIRYTKAQIDRLRILGIALSCGARAADVLCRNVALLATNDADLKRLLKAVQAEPPADGDNGVLRRAALLHTDIDLLVPAVARGADDRPVSAQSVRIEFDDGQQKRLTVGPIHLKIARMLLDEVKPADMERPDPGRDDMVRAWYHATTAWLQAKEEYEPEHLEHGRHIFPDDPVLQFFSGALHEAYAAPTVQTMARGVALPTGITVGVRSRRAELGQAEDFFRRALDLDPEMREARLRLGHVLLMQEHYADAATELRKVLDLSGEPLLQFYTAMFLGAAEEALGNASDAAEQYSNAAKLYPTAQSPKVALSALARRRGDRDAAWHAMQQLFALPNTEPDRDDPWWSYTKQQGRSAELLLENVRRPFERGAPQ